MKKKLAILCLVGVFTAYSTAHAQPKDETQIKIGSEKGNTPLTEVIKEQNEQGKKTTPNVEKQEETEVPAIYSTDVPKSTSLYSESNPAPLKAVLTWTPYNMAVAYEFQLWSGIKPEDTKIQPKMLLSNRYVNTNAYDIDLKPYVDEEELAWRVRPLNIDGIALSDFSSFESLYINAKEKGINYPYQLSDYDISNSNGSVLLYPVYNFVPVQGAVKYEVELLNREPENPLGTTASQYRIWSKTFNLADIYDDFPRMGSQAFFWRVRAFAPNDVPLGTYSPTRHFMTDPRVGWQVGVFGDSISHGGGDMSYSPADFVYSWIHYLQDPAVNLSASGDTSASLLARFDRDVLPFHPHYLLIMGGTNSLRSSASSEDVIEDLQAIKEKCLANNIKPIFLTLLPINPTNIYRCFKEDTAPDWAGKFAAVNNYIRTQVHVDVAAAMPFGQELLPTNMGIDGLHPTALVKQIIGQTINEQWDKVTKEADAQ